MRYEHPHGVRIVWIDVEDMRLAEEVGEQQIVFTAVPFATNPSDAVYQAHGPKTMSFRYDKVGRRTAIDPRCRNLGTSARAIPSRSEHIRRPDCSVQETTTGIFLSAAMSLRWRTFYASGVWLVFLGSRSTLWGRGSTARILATVQ